VYRQAVSLSGVTTSVAVLIGAALLGVAGAILAVPFAAVIKIVLREATADAQGAATSALSLTDSLGTALGTGITGAIVAASLRATGNPAAGLAAGFAVALAIGLGGLALTGRLRPRTATAGAMALSPASPPS